MQKQKINYLTLQNTYENIEIALFANQLVSGNHELTEKKIISKLESSKNLIPAIDLILSKNKLKLNDLDFLAENKGPGPYTTLRVVVVTANALSYATNIPLIGIDGLQALQEEFKNIDAQVSVAILNAYNNDVYYSIKFDNQYEEGWKNIDAFLNYLKSKFTNEKIRFIGNGVALFNQQIKKILGDNAQFEKINPEYCSIEQIAKMAYKNWLNKENIADQIIPLYLKDAIILK